MATAPPLAASRTFHWRPLAWPVLLAVTIGLTLMLAWTGYTASDDASYYAGAQHWLANPPYAGNDHWTTRFPVVLSFAGALLIFGKQSFLPFGATALAWYAALVAVGGRATASIAGPKAGWIAAILVASMPVIASEASTVGCDLAEALFLLTGAWLIGATMDKPQRGGPAIAAGLCFGLAILCRETAALALLGFAPLLLVGRPVPRRTLVLVGLAAATVLLGEAAFQWALTGDPFHRYALAFNHDSHIDRSANLEGNLLVHPAIDPLLVLLVNNDFALLFWLALAATLMGLHHRLDSLQRRRLLIPICLGAAAFLLVALLSTKLVLNPRYFTMPALAAAMLVAIWLSKLAPPARAWLLLTAVGANLLMLSAQNAHPRWPAEALVAAAAAHPGETVFATRETIHRAELPLRFAGIGNVRSGTAGVGQLYLAREDGLTPGQLVTRYAAPPTPLGGIVRTLRLQGQLPAAVRRRLLEPEPAMLLLRMGPPRT